MKKRKDKRYLKNQNKKHKIKFMKNLKKHSKTMDLKL